MSKSTESIFDGKDVLIPLAEVSYILKFPSCIEVHFKGSAESVTLVQPDQNALVSAWCRYRGEVEADTLMDLDGAQPAPSIPEGWKPIPEKHPTFDLVDLRLADGSVLCECVPQSDGDYWWEGPSGEVFIDPKYAPVTHWRLAAAPEAKP